MQEEWERDDDEYRESKAVQWFNFAMSSSRDLLELKPTLESWVPHIACFIVPRQIKWLGNPVKRSADACESYGAMVKRIIKHKTCRRRVKGSSSTGPTFAHIHKRGDRRWHQTFTRGYLEQAFRRCCVKELLLHGELNEPYLQRSDWKLKDKGVKSERVKSEKVVPPSVRSCMSVEADM